MIPAFLAACVIAGPARLVIGLDHPDLRHTSAHIKVDRVLRELDATLVHRLSFALVIDVPEGEAMARLPPPGVLWAEEDVRIPIALRAVPDDPLYPEQWSLHLTTRSVAEAPINVEPAWDITRGTTSGGAAVRVAVIDDGFDLLHEDLAANIGGGRDFSADPWDDDATASSGDIHGTQTAGVIAARGFNGVGITGACPECEILPVRLIHGGGPPDMYTTGSTVAAAIQWAVDHGAAVINNSWGPPDGNRFEPFHPVETWVLPLPAMVDEALRYAAREGRGGLGTVIVWSAGNGNELATYDGFASDPRVIAVGSVNAEGIRAYYSDFGPPLRLVAPSSGLDPMPAILTTDLSGDAGESSTDYFDGYGGTSASAALVAGVAALVIAHQPQLTAAQVMETLFDSGFAIDPDRGQYVDGHSQLYGHGRLDAASALALAAEYSGTHTRWLEVCGNDRDDDGDGSDAACAVCIPDNPTEYCDGRDNNCNGFADEYFVCDTRDRPVCAPCTTSAQCALGSKCRAANDFPGTWCFEECTSSCPPGFSCNGEVCILLPAPEALDCFDLLRCGQRERCDRLDNDCNGVVDDVDTGGLEAIVAMRECGERGVCAGSIAYCVDGQWQCARAERWQAIETRCDDLDNDCDGDIDEGPVCAARERRLAGDEGCDCSARHNGWMAILAAVLVLRRRRLAPLSCGR